MTPDESTFQSHLKLPRYILGESENRWKLERITWPYAWFSLPATRPGGEIDRYWFRFELTNYPQQAPAGCLWDEGGNCLLPAAKWPTGSSIGLVFNPNWNGATALYLPCDRVAMQGHETWRSDHPTLWWTPDKTILTYLAELYELLNRRDYQGPATR